MIPCVYDEKQHEVLSSEVARWSSRNAPADWKDRLFTYRHSITENFVVAVWADKPFGIFTDVLNLGKSLSNFNRETADELLRRMWQPLSPSTISQQINRTQSDFHSKQVEKNNEMKELINRRRGK